MLQKRKSLGIETGQVVFFTTTQAVGLAQWLMLELHTTGSGKPRTSSLYSYQHTILGVLQVQ